MRMGKILDLSERLKHKSVSLTGIEGSAEATVMDITEKRMESLRKDRRQVKRTILTEFISVHTVVPESGLLKVALYDLNPHGLSFDIEIDKGSFKMGEEVAMRVYLNHQTYFPFFTKVKHITHYNDEGLIRHGVEFVKGSINDIALQHFIGFLESVSASLKHDKGDVLVSNINS
jgi:hypothetical protein